MENHFLKFISEKQLATQNDKILLAISGGVDSMLMLYLFARAKIPVGVAHCNFQLRGKDSLADHDLVAEMAQNYGLDFYTTRFETKDYAKENGISTQMAARDLRYNWFEEIREKYGYTLIATAHHRDDVVETFLLNLLRKTGIGGLHGIKVRAGCIIRPMLFASKKEIVEYAQKQNIAYREDISNKDDHYKRNFLRLHVIPDFQQLNPNFTTTLQDSIHIISKQETLYKEYVFHAIRSITKEFKNGFSIDIACLQNLSLPEVHLFELLHPLGFSETQINDLMNSLDKTEEKIFLSSTFRLVKTRTSIEWYPIQEKENNNLVVINDINDFQKVNISISIFENAADFIFENQSSIAYFDLNKLIFPLKIRSWKTGDYFYPFNGKGKKKLSDFFSEKKLSGIEKQNVKLLCTQNGDIVWVIGFRNDDRYKISRKTEKILELRWKI